MPRLDGAAQWSHDRPQRAPKQVECGISPARAPLNKKGCSCREGRREPPPPAAPLNPRPLFNTSPLSFHSHLASVWGRTRHPRRSRRLCAWPCRPSCPCQPPCLHEHRKGRWLLSGGSAAAWHGTLAAAIAAHACCTAWPATRQLHSPGSCSLDLLLSLFPRRMHLAALCRHQPTWRVVAQQLV